MEEKRSLAGSAAKLLACGAFGALATVLALLVSAAIAVSAGRYSAVERPALYISAVIGGAVSGFAAARAMGKNGILNGGIASAVSALLLSLPSLFTSGGGVIPALVCFAGGLFGGIAGVNLKHR